MNAYLLTSDLAISSAVSGAAERQGIDLVSAFTTAALRVKLIETTPQLVIVDLSTSGLDIGEFISQLREQLPQGPIIAFGPHVHESRLAAAREAGCDEVFSRGQFHRDMDQILARSIAGPDPKEETLPLCQSIESGRLKVEFFKLGDRLGHRFVYSGGNRQTLWLESIEGDARDHWPPSPALQEVHIEARPNDRRVAMCVGQAGSNHYSASFEPGDRPGSICVEVAARVKSGEGPLSSSYRMASGKMFDPKVNAVVDSVADSVADSGGQRCQILAQSSGNQLCSITQNEEQWVIEPKDQTDSVSHTQRPQTLRPQTLCWRYEIWIH